MHAELTVYREEHHIDLMWDVSVHPKCVLPVDLGAPGTYCGCSRTRQILLVKVSGRR